MNVQHGNRPFYFFCIFSLGHKCGTRQPFQQQTQETVEAAEICRMSGQKGMLFKINNNNNNALIKNTNDVSLWYRVYRKGVKGLVE